MLRYHLLAFLSGAIVLVLEIMGTRLFAPYLGTAFFVWVNVIGVILAALSLGYWLGGVFADRNQKMLPLIFLGGAGTVALMLLWRIFLTHFGALGIRLGSLLAALLLFAPPSLILGMVSPYLIKLAAYDLAHLGQTSGRIYAASTLGSIIGKHCRYVCNWFLADSPLHNHSNHMGDGCNPVSACVFGQPWSKAPFSRP